MRKVLWALVACLIAGLLAPAGEAFHGAWWRARDQHATSLGMGLDHDAHPVSAATRMATGEVFRVDFQWSGQQWGFGLFDGAATVKLYDDTGALVHQATLLVRQNFGETVWAQCPAGTGDDDIELETSPTYGLFSEGILTLGAGFPGGSGVARASFCGNFGDPADPYYFRSFSDFEGTYIPDVPALGGFRLHLHVRGFDHG